MFNVCFNIPEFLGAERQILGGYWLPPGELTVIGPMLIAVHAIILFTHKWGIYTRWLATVTFITFLALIYSLNPAAFQEMPCHWWYPARHSHDPLRSFSNSYFFYYSSLWWEQFSIFSIAQGACFNHRSPLSKFYLISKYDLIRWHLLHCTGYVTSFTLTCFTALA
jgi:hypothetical protein